MHIECDTNCYIIAMVTFNFVKYTHNRDATIQNKIHMSQRKVYLASQQ